MFGQLPDAPLGSFEEGRVEDDYGVARTPEGASPQARCTPADPAELLDRIECLDRRLLRAFQERLRIDAGLTRQLVSFQGNKASRAYRWYKFKEAFSAALVRHLLGRYGVCSGRVLDPFAGSGTALFAASSLGLDADGIELLPIGHEIVSARLCGEREFTERDLEVLDAWAKQRPWIHSKARVPLPSLRITEGAYPPETAEGIERYLGAIAGEDPRVQTVLRFALLCILEAVSYTRKDGQYLRWDHRSGRRQNPRKPFEKGAIASFDEAMAAKLGEIHSDLHAQLRLEAPRPRGVVRLYKGSVLRILPTLPECSYDAIVTSPPYCNRYDYTRTYALELALVGVSEEAIADLRQEMLSCTVENRAKDLPSLNPKWAAAVEAADNQQLLQAVIAYLETLKRQGRLNNAGIPRMVRGYFYEMACVLYECARVLKPNAPLLMVNDNVRYAGASVSVDLILSDIAQALGFRVDDVLVLPNGKGNSSQQMGHHGREPLRKGVYVWRKARHGLGDRGECTFRSAHSP